jgi:hypothetical protein
MKLSYNGWTSSPDPADFGGLSTLTVAGESFAPGVRAGDVHTVLEYVATQLHLRVEPVIATGFHSDDDWGYSYRKNVNGNNLSCHASGTAIDYNATRHPNGKAGTFTSGQVAEIRRILTEVDGVVRWGGDFTGTKDEMHFEICTNATTVAATATRIRGAATPAARRPTLRRGSTGQAVRDLQAHLNRTYPAYSALTVDGDFGPATEMVVKEFQRRSGLATDGVVGPRTWAALARSASWFSALSDA